MKTAAEWIVEQSINNPRVGSLEHKIMCDAIRAIQRDALESSAEIANVKLKRMDQITAAYASAVEIREAILERSREI